MIAAGIVLLIAGFFISNLKMGGDGHGSGHGDEGHGTEEHDGGGAHEDHHSDAGEMVRYASSEHGAVGAGEHGHGHGEAEEGHGHGSDHMENETWRRAYYYDVQSSLPHHEKHVTAGSKIGSSLLIGSFWWMLVALFGVFFIAVSYTANAGWYVAVKRVLENYYRFLPIGAIMILAIFFIFGKDVWEWYALEEGEDFIVDGKRPFLNVAFVIITCVFFVGIWSFVGHLLKGYSKAEEAEGGLENHRKSRIASAAFLPFFGLSFSICAFLWIMSVDPHWFSTIFAVYCFAGLMISGATITMFISTHLHEKGWLNKLPEDVVHDLGKFMFAFSVFWAYIWVSQYLLIWYANIPEETIYYYNRFEDFQLLFALNVVLNFFYPFIALMTRKAKRTVESLRGIGTVMMLGRFLDIYLLVAPGVLGAAAGFGTLVMAFGGFMLMGGIFLFVVFKGYEDLPLDATKHPYYEESLHHSVGV